MSMIFRLTMLSDDNDRFVREYEVPYDISLMDLHEYICSDLRFDPSSVVSFFLSDKYWNKSEEFAMFDTGEDGPRNMGSVTLGQILHHNHDRLIYTFDVFTDRSLFIELTGASESRPGTRYPLTAVSEELPPDQFDASAASGEGVSIFDEALGEFGMFEGDDTYEEEF